MFLLEPLPVSLATVDVPGFKRCPLSPFLPETVFRKDLRRRPSVFPFGPFCQFRAEIPRYLYGERSRRPFCRRFSPSTSPRFFTGDESSTAKIFTLTLLSPSKILRIMPYELNFFFTNQFVAGAYPELTPLLFFLLFGPWPVLRTQRWVVQSEGTRPANLRLSSSVQT